jgi:hypothetical protein
MMLWKSAFFPQPSVRALSNLTGAVLISVSNYYAACLERTCDLIVRIHLISRNKTRHVNAVCLPACLPSSITKQIRSHLLPVSTDTKNETNYFNVRERIKFQPVLLCQVFNRSTHLAAVIRQSLRPGIGLVICTRLDTRKRAAVCSRPFPAYKGSVFFYASKRPSIFYIYLVWKNIHIYCGFCV